jgi:hypothetical protein
MKRPPNIPEDKANHYIYTQLITLGVYVACFMNQIADAMLISLGAGAAVAVLWEVYQKATKSGKPSVLDAVVGILGSVAVLVPVYLLQ